MTLTEKAYAKKTLNTMYKHWGPQKTKQILKEMQNLINKEVGEKHYPPKIIKAI